MLRLREVAERLNCSVQTVHNLKDRGLLAVVKTGVSKGYRVEEAELERFLRERREHPGKNAPPPPKKARPFTFLNGERLRQAWREQDARASPRRAGNAPSSGS